MGAAPNIRESGSSYRHVLYLARGGMGKVELAMREEGAFKRFYAVKRLHAHFRDDPEFRSMFLDEARVAGLIRHRNVVSVLDVGEDAEGPFLVMDFVEGPSVAILLKRLAGRGVRIPVQLATDIIAQACRGLHAAHELHSHDGEPLKLVHRDVSPQNLLIGFDGGVSVTDFGVAKALGRQTNTESGILKGKMGYMSPEQLRFREVDHRSDLFSIGVVLFELLSGTRLYSSKTRPAPLAILEDPVPDVGEHYSDLPPELVLLSMELLAKDPELRPASAKDVAERLEEITSELRREHARVTLSDYICTWFADDRDALQERISLAEEVPVKPREAPPIAGPSTPRLASPAQPRRGLVTAFVAVAVALVVLAVVAVASRTGAPQPVAEPVPDRAAVREEAPSPIVVAPRPQPEAPTTPSASTTETEPAVMRASMRSRPRPSGQDRGMQGMSGPVILDWD